MLCLKVRLVMETTAIGGGDGVGANPAVANATGSIAIGGSSVTGTTAANAIAFGFSSNASGATSMALGSNANASGTNAIAIATNAVSAAGSAETGPGAIDNGNTDASVYGENATCAR